MWPTGPEPVQPAAVAALELGRPPGRAWPLVRCRSLQGLGLCQWRGGDFDAAERTFRRMLMVCPEDGIGARILLAEVRARRLFEDLAGSDDIPF